MKKTLWILSFSTVLVGGALVVPSFIDWRSSAEFARQMVAEKSGYDLRLKGSVGLSLLPVPYIYASNVELANSATSQTEAFLKIKTVSAQLSLLSLLGGEVVFSSVVLEKPVVNLNVDKNGAANWVALPQTPTPSDTTNPETEQKSDSAAHSASAGIAITDLKITDGSLTYRAAPDAAPIEITDLSGLFSAGSLQGPFQSQGSARFMDQPIEFEASTGQFTASDTTSPDFPVNILLRKGDGAASVRYSGVAAFAQPLAETLRYQGEIEGSFSGLPPLARNFSPKSLKLSGLVTGDTRTLKGKDLKLVLDNDERQTFATTLETNFSPMRAQINLAAGPDFLLGPVETLLTVDMRDGLGTDSGMLRANLSMFPVNLADLNKLNGSASSELPAPLREVALKLAYEGTAERGNLAGGITAAGMNLTASTTLESPFASPKTGVIRAELKHDKLAKLYSAFVGADSGFANWDKPVALTADVLLVEDQIRLQSLKGLVAGIPTQGQLTIDTAAGTPAISGDLALGSVILADGAPSARNANAISPAAGTESKKPKTAKSQGPWSDEPINLTWMRGVSVDIGLNAERFDYAGWQLNKPQLKTIINDGTLRIENLKAGMFGGQLGMQASIRARDVGMDVTAKTTLSGARLGDLAQALMHSNLIRGQGSVSLTTDLTSTGSSQRALISALDGSGTITGRDFIFEGFDLNRLATSLTKSAKPDDRILDLLQGTLDGGRTAFDTLDGAYTLTQGTMNFEKLDLDGKVASMKTTGSIDLPAWSLQTTHNIKLKQQADIPEFSIKLSGSLSNPLQEFGQGLLQDYLAKKAQKKIEKFLTKELGDKLPQLLGAPPASPAQQPDPAAQPSPSTPAGPAASPPAPEKTRPEDAIKDVLKGILQ